MSDADPAHHEAKVTIIEAPPRALYLRETLGEGTVDGEEFEICSIVGSGSLYVRFEDRERPFLLPVRQFVEAAYRIHRKQQADDE